MGTTHKTKSKSTYLTELEAARETVRTLVGAGQRLELSIYDAAHLHGVSRNELTTIVQASVQS